MKTETKQYRTQEQFDQIIDSVINGNYTQASQLSVEYGFYATDFKIFVENTEWVHGHPYFNVIDLYWVIQDATKLRKGED